MSNEFDIFDAAALEDEAEGSVEDVAAGKLFDESTKPAESGSAPSTGPSDNSVLQKPKPADNGSGQSSSPRPTDIIRNTLPGDRTQNPGDVGSILNRISFAEIALDDMADKAEGLSKIERAALKDLQRAILSGKESKIADIVAGFKDNPEALKKIADALKKNLDGEGISVNFELVAGKNGTQYGKLTFGLKTDQASGQISYRTDGGAEFTPLTRALASAMSDMIEQRFMPRPNKHPGNGGGSGPIELPPGTKPGQKPGQGSGSGELPPVIPSPGHKPGHGSGSGDSVPPIDWKKLKNR